MSSSDETTTRTGDAMRLLEILTPGGSEFHENPQRCAAWVQERLDSAQRLTVRAYTERNEMRQENARLRERVAALEEQAEQSDWRVLKLTDALADAVLLIHETRHDGAPAGCAERICEIGKQLVQAARDSAVDNLAAALAQADDGGRA